MIRVAVPVIFGLLVAGVTTAAAQTPGGIETRTVEYSRDGTTYRGYLAKPTGPVPQALRGDDSDERPGVLVVHEWWGLNDYAKKRADMLAELGYVAFVADMFGEGKTTTSADAAKAMAGPLYQDRAQMRARAQAALAQLEEVDGVDDDRLAAIGYCFGGTVVTELAYAEGQDDDTDLRGVVSFHGAPMPPTDGDARVATRVLLLHGEDDPMVKQSDVEAVAAAVRERKGDAKVVVYPDAVHSFTNPGADKVGLEGAGYNQAADKASWREMQAFLLAAMKDH